MNDGSSHLLQKAVEYLARPDIERITYQVAQKHCECAQIGEAPLSLRAKRSEVAAIHTPHGSCDFAQDDRRWV